MKSRDYTQLLVELKEKITKRSPRSAASNETAKAYLADGGSHTLGLFQPFPLRIVAAQGAWIKDKDDHQILDFWQGHLGKILCYNLHFRTKRSIFILRRLMRPSFSRNRIRK